MQWTVIFDPEFSEWLRQQETDVRSSILSHLNFLKLRGPTLGRPYVDTIQGSKLPNLKELRVQHQGEPWRILFVFDPKRQAVLLVGGNKQGNDRWYKEFISIAEKRYERHLKELEQENGN